MQTVELDYTPEGMGVHITNVRHSNLSQNGSYLPAGINRGSFYRRTELDSLFGRIGWHRVSDNGQVLIYEGPLNPMPA